VGKAKYPPAPSEEERKKFMFYDTEKNQIDLRIRLQYDGMNQSNFFRAMITGYLEKNEHIMEYIADYKERYIVHNKKKRKETAKLLEKGRELEKDFALDEDDIENIFDILEKEHPDL